MAGQQVKDIKMTEEQAKFAAENYGLVLKYLHKNKLYPVEDWEGLCAIAYCKAIQKYDASKGSFSNYAFIWMKGAVNKYRRNQFHRNGFDRSMIRLDDVLGDDNDGYSEYNEVEGKLDDNLESIGFRLDYEEILKKVPERTRKIVGLRFQGLTQQQIAERLGVAQVTISRDLKKLADALCA